jgi:hypothetical protein
VEALQSVSQSLFFTDSFVQSGLLNDHGSLTAYGFKEFQIVLVELIIDSYTV